VGSPKTRLENHVGFRAEKKGDPVFKIAVRPARFAELASEIYQ